MSENKITFPVKLASNNPQSFGIVDATEISGHRRVNTLSDLYAISDPILSILKDGSDAIGQEWFIVSENCKYRLDNWGNRKSVSGWTKLPKQELINTKQSVSEKDQPSGYAGLDSNGKIPIEKTYGATATVVDVETYESLPVTGVSGVIYYVSNTSAQYKWSGSAYIDITDGADNAKKNETSIFDCSNGTSTKYYTSLLAAINVVPPAYRTSNRIISYLSKENSTTSAVNYQYHGIDSTTWTDLTKWERVPNQADLAEIRSDLNDSIYPYKSLNIFNKNTAIIGKYINVGNGELIDHADFFCSDFIPVSAGLKYYTSLPFDFLCFYDDINMITGIALGGQTEIDLSGSDSWYNNVTRIRISSSKENLNGMQLSNDQDMSKGYKSYLDNTSFFGKHGYNGATEKILTIRDVDKKILNDNINTYNRYIEGTEPFQFDNGWLTNVDAVLFDGVVETIRIRVGIEQDYTFGVGILDQYLKPIIRETHLVHIPVVGYTTSIVNVHIPIKKGEHLFISFSATVTKQLIYNVTEPSGTDCYFSDSPTVAMSTFSANLDTGGIPFSFDVKNHDSNFVLKDDFEMLKSDVGVISSKINSDIVKIKSDDGIFYQIGVNSSGTIYLKDLSVRRWLALGNSITRHPITSFWWGDWGMAATTRENDWVHKLNSKISSRQSVIPSFTAHNISDFELYHSPSYDFSVFNSLFVGDEDMVVVRLGENAVVTPTYQSDFELLLDYIKSKAPNAKIVVTGLFWYDGVRNTAQYNAAIAKECIWVELSQLDNAANKSTVDTLVYGDDLQWHTISDGGASADGVANHPSDVGMDNIANSILALI